MQEKLMWLSDSDTIIKKLNTDNNRKQQNLFVTLLPATKETIMQRWPHELVSAIDYGGHIFQLKFGKMVCI